MGPPIFIACLAVLSVSVARSSAQGCAPCNEVTCPPLPFCENGKSLDDCGCCPVCTVKGEHYEEKEERNQFLQLPLVKSPFSSTLRVKSHPATTAERHPDKESNGLTVDKSPRSHQVHTWIHRMHQQPLHSEQNIRKSFKEISENSLIDVSNTIESQQIVDTTQHLNTALNNSNKFRRSLHLKPPKERSTGIGPSGISSKLARLCSELIRLVLTWIHDISADDQGRIKRDIPGTRRTIGEISNLFGSLWKKFLYVIQQLTSPGVRPVVEYLIKAAGNIAAQIASWLMKMAHNALQVKSNNNEDVMSRSSFTGETSMPFLARIKEVIRYVIHWLTEPKFVEIISEVTGVVVKGGVELFEHIIEYLTQQLTTNTSFLRKRRSYFPYPYPNDNEAEEYWTKSLVEHSDSKERNVRSQKPKSFIETLAQACADIVKQILNWIHNLFTDDTNHSARKRRALSLIDIYSLVRRILAEIQKGLSYIWEPLKQATARLTSPNVRSIVMNALGYIGGLVRSVVGWIMTQIHNGLTGGISTDDVIMERGLFGDGLLDVFSMIKRIIVKFIDVLTSPKIVKLLSDITKISVRDIADIVVRVIQYLSSEVSGSGSSGGDDGGGSHFYEDLEERSMFPANKKSASSLKKGPKGKQAVQEIQPRNLSVLLSELCSELVRTVLTWIHNLSSDDASYTARAKRELPTTGLMGKARRTLGEIRSLFGTFWEKILYLVQQLTSPTGRKITESVISFAGNIAAKIANKIMELTHNFLQNRSRQESQDIMERAFLETDSISSFFSAVREAVRYLIHAMTHPKIVDIVSKVTEIVVKGGVELLEHIAEYLSNQLRSTRSYRSPSRERRSSYFKSDYTAAEEVQSTKLHRVSRNPTPCVKSKCPRSITVSNFIETFAQACADLVRKILAWIHGLTSDDSNYSARIRRSLSFSNIQSIAQNAYDIVKKVLYYGWNIGKPIMEKLLSSEGFQSILKRVGSFIISVVKWIATGVYNAFFGGGQTSGYGDQSVLERSYFDNPVLDIYQLIKQLVVKIIQMATSPQVANILSHLTRITVRDVSEIAVKIVRYLSSQISGSGSNVYDDMNGSSLALRIAPVAKNSLRKVSNKETFHDYSPKSSNSLSSKLAQLCSEFIRVVLTWIHDISADDQGRIKRDIPGTRRTIGEISNLFGSLWRKFLYVIQQLTSPGVRPVVEYLIKAAGNIAAQIASWLMKMVHNALQVKSNNNEDVMSRSSFTGETSMPFLARIKEVIRYVIHWLTEPKFVEIISEVTGIIVKGGVELFEHIIEYLTQQLTTNTSFLRKRRSYFPYQYPNDNEAEEYWTKSLVEHSDSKERNVRSQKPKSFIETLAQACADIVKQILNWIHNLFTDDTNHSARKRRALSLIDIYSLVRRILAEVQKGLSYIWEPLKQATARLTSPNVRSIVMNALGYIGGLVRSVVGWIMTQIHNGLTGGISTDDVIMERGLFGDGLLDVFSMIKRIIVKFIDVLTSPKIVKLLSDITKISVRDIADIVVRVIQYLSSEVSGSGSSGGDDGGGSHFYEDLEERSMFPANKKSASSLKKGPKGKQAVQEIQPRNLSVLLSELCSELVRTVLTWIHNLSSDDASYTARAKRELPTTGLMGKARRTLGEIRSLFGTFWEKILYLVQQLTSPTGRKITESVISFAGNIAAKIANKIMELTHNFLQNRSRQESQDIMERAFLETDSISSFFSAVREAVRYLIHAMTHPKIVDIVSNVTEIVVKGGVELLEHVAEYLSNQLRSTRSYRSPSRERRSSYFKSDYTAAEEVQSTKLHRVSRNPTPCVKSKCPRSITVSNFIETFAQACADLVRKILAWIHGLTSDDSNYSARIRRSLSFSNIQSIAQNAYDIVKKVLYYGWNIGKPIMEKLLSSEGFQSILKRVGSFIISVVKWIATGVYNAFFGGGQTSGYGDQSVLERSYFDNPVLDIYQLIKQLVVKIIQMATSPQVANILSHLTRITVRDVSEIAVKIVRYLSSQISGSGSDVYDDMNGSSLALRIAPVAKNSLRKVSNKETFHDYSPPKNSNSLSSKLAQLCSEFIRVVLTWIHDISADDQGRIKRDIPGTRRTIGEISNLFGSLWRKFLYVIQQLTSPGVRPVVEYLIKAAGNIAAQIASWLMKMVHNALQDKSNNNEDVMSRSSFTEETSMPFLARIKEVIRYVIHWLTEPKFVEIVSDVTGIIVKGGVELFEHIIEYLTQQLKTNTSFLRKRRNPLPDLDYNNRVSVWSEEVDDHPSGKERYVRSQKMRSFIEMLAQACADIVNQLLTWIHDLFAGGADFSKRFRRAGFLMKRSTLSTSLARLCSELVRIIMSWLHNLSSDGISRETRLKREYSKYSYGENTRKLFNVIQQMFSDFWIIICESVKNLSSPNMRHLIGKFVRLLGEFAVQVVDLIMSYLHNAFSDAIKSVEEVSVRLYPKEGFLDYVMKLKDVFSLGLQFFTSPKMVQYTTDISKIIIRNSGRLIADVVNYIFSQWSSKTMTPPGYGAIGSSFHQAPSRFSIWTFLGETISTVYTYVVNMFQNLMVKVFNLRISDKIWGVLKTIASLFRGIVSFVYDLLLKLFHQPVSERIYPYDDGHPSWRYVGNVALKILERLMSVVVSVTRDLTNPTITYITKVALKGASVMISTVSGDLVESGMSFINHLVTEGSIGQVKNDPELLLSSNNKQAISNDHTNEGMLRALPSESMVQSIKSSLKENIVNQTVLLANEANSSVRNDSSGNTTNGLAPQRNYSSTVTHSGKRKRREVTEGIVNNTLKNNGRFPINEDYPLAENEGYLNPQFYGTPVYILVKIKSLNDYDEQDIDENSMSDSNESPF